MHAAATSVRRWTIHIDPFGFVLFDFHAEPLQAGEIEFSLNGPYGHIVEEFGERAAALGWVPAGDMRLTQRDQSYREARAALAAAGW